MQSLIVGINDDEMNMDNHTDMTATERHNNTYHCCKIMYLVDQYRTVGLHSTIQGIIEGQHMFVHPGMSRVHALSYLKARNEKIIMWDTNNTFTDKKPLTYEQWRKVFDIEDKQIFAANVDGKLIEMHIKEYFSRFFILNPTFMGKTRKMQKKPDVPHCPFELPSS